MANTPVTFPKNLFGLSAFDVVLIEAETFAGKKQPIFGMTGDSTKDEPDYYSKLGTPVYGSLRLGSTDPNKTPQNEYVGVDGKTYTFDTVKLDIAIITVNMKKNVVKTQIQGLRGSVKQFIALGDYDITINGVIDDVQNTSPTQAVLALHKAAAAEIAIPVTNYFLNQFGIYYIVIEDLNMPQMEGRYSSQIFTIRACSDFNQDEMLP